MTPREPWDVRVLRPLNPEQAPRRRSLKLALLLAATLLVLYPNPLLLVRHVQRTLTMNALISTADPRVAELAMPLRPAAANGRHSEVFAGVQRAVHARLPYQYDWDNWGCANYFPTVDEALTRGRCDCKGRAVVAASVLASLGYAPRLVSDLSHVWVWTKEGETMGPVATRSGRRVVTADERGSRIDPRAIVSSGGLLTDMPVRLGFGIAVFPVERVAVLAAVLWLVCLRVRPRWAFVVLGALLMGLAIAGFRHWCTKLTSASAPGAWAAIACAVAGVVLSRFRTRVLPAMASEAEEKPSIGGQ